MSKNILKNIIVILPLFFAGISAQDQVDAIEAARQAKAAAEKAAADAEAATGAAIEAAAAKAAKEAREKIKQDKLDEEARKVAEKKAAEEAELDAAAAAAAEEAKRKMAEELGLEYEAPSNSEAVSEEDSIEGVSEEEEEEEEEVSAEEVVVREQLGYNIGLTGSSGLINGEFITNTPVGFSLVITTPIGFKLGKSALDFSVSVLAGSYSGESSDGNFDPITVGLGGNLELFNMLFYEGHVGLIGAGPGGRGFAGVSLEKILNNIKLPINVLVGAEGFLSTKPSDKREEASYWGGIGLRIDYSF